MVFRRGAKATDESGPDDPSTLVRRSSELQVHRPAGPEPLPDAKHMPLGGRWTRDACWPRVPVPVVTRLGELTGERIEWWAAMLSQGTGDAWGKAGMVTAAVVFGRDAVCFADPQPAGPG